MDIFLAKRASWGTFIYAFDESIVLGWLNRLTAGYIYRVSVARQMREWPFGEEFRQI